MSAISPLYTALTVNQKAAKLKNLLSKPKAIQEGYSRVDVFMCSLPQEISRRPTINGERICMGLSIQLQYWHTGTN